MTDISGFYRDAARPATGARTTALARAERPLRIVMTCHSGGTKDSPRETFLRELPRALCDLGHSVDIICGAPYPRLDRRVRLVKIPSLGLYDKDRSLFRMLAKIYDATDIAEFLRFLCGLYVEPRSFGARLARFIAPRCSYYDVMHDIQSLSYGLLDLKRQGLPVIATLVQPLTRDRTIALDAAKSWYRRLRVAQWYRFVGMQARVAPRLDRLCTNSQSLKGDVAQELTGDVTRYHAIAPGIDHGIFRPHPGTPRQPRRLVATISPHAALSDIVPLLRALAELAANDSQLRLIMVGPAQGMALQGLVRALGIGERFELVSKISERERAHLFCEATLFIAWSDHESLAFHSAEAMACETPVIAIDTKLMREILGEQGVLVEKASAPALVHAIAALLNAPLTRAKLARQGRQRALTHFDWRLTAQRYVALYRDAMASVIC